MGSFCTFRNVLRQLVCARVAYSLVEWPSGDEEKQGEFHLHIRLCFCVLFDSNRARHRTVWPGFISSCLFFFSLFFLSLFFLPLCIFASSIHHDLLSTLCISCAIIENQARLWFLDRGVSSLCVCADDWEKKKTKFFDWFTERYLHWREKKTKVAHYNFVICTELFLHLYTY